MSNINIPGAEKSNGELSGYPGSNITHLMWPNYRRITAAAGGDVSASFTFSADDSEVEAWLYDYLAREFTEVYQGKPCFNGRIHTMRLAYNRVIITVSLDWLFNRVACQYTSALDNSAMTTDFYDDLYSQAAYGIREHIIRPSDAIGLSEAEDLAQEFLADYAWPRYSRGKQDRKLDKGVLQVTMQGYSQTLDAQFYNYETEGEDDAANEVAAVLSGASFLTAGEIFANTTQVSIKSDYRRRLQRIDTIADRRDSLGRRYRYGAVAGKVFDYWPVEEPELGATPTIRYSLLAKRPFLIYQDNNGHDVPAPLVRPGGWSRISDMRDPISVKSIHNNPLYQFDATVQYDKDGAILQGGAWGPQERAEALQMKLIGMRS